MTGKFLISATVAAGFWRCGRHFPKAGIVVDADEFNDGQWERLNDEPMLRVSEASKEDAAALDERAARIADGIEALEAVDFQRDGKPKLESLNALLGDDLGKITAVERDAVWAVMKENGFEAPDAVS